MRLWSAARGPARTASIPTIVWGTGRLHQPGRTTTSIWSEPHSDQAHTGRTGRRGHIAAPSCRQPRPGDPKRLNRPKTADSHQPPRYRSASASCSALLRFVPSESGARTGAGSCSVASAGAPRACSSRANPRLASSWPLSASPGRSRAIAAANRETALDTSCSSDRSDARGGRGCRSSDSEPGRFIVAWRVGDLRPRSRRQLAQTMIEPSVGPHAGPAI